MKFKRIIAAVMALAIVGVNYGASGYQYGSGSSAFAAEDTAADSTAAEKAEKVEVNGMIFEAVEGGYALLTISRSAKELVVPDEVNGYPVVSISSRFGSSSKCVDIESVKLGKNVRTIEESAFSICKNISVLELNDGLESIGDRAFCTDMLTAPLVLPETVTYVGERAFFNCHHIPSITVTNPDCVLGELFAETFLFGYKGSTAEKYAAENARGSSLNAGPSRSQYHYEWDFFDIEDKSVPRDVCDKDGIFYIPTEGGYKVYYTDDTITELNIPDRVNGYAVVEVTHDFCRGNNLYERLTSVKLGRNIRRIGNNAFSDCDLLTELELNDSLESIGLYAFRCENVTTPIIIPDTVKHIGYHAFMHGYDPISITILSDDCEFDTDCFGKADLYGFKGSTAEEYAKANDRVTFHEIEDTRTPAEKIEVDGMRFAPTKGGYILDAISTEITDLVIPDEVNGYPVIEIKSQIGNGRESLRSVKLGKNVKTIGKNAFSSCESIKSLELNDALETVGDDAFSSCPIETPLIFPETIKYIGESAFSYATKIPSITITNRDCVLGENFILRTAMIGYKGSTAEEYVKKTNRHELEFCDIENENTPRDIYVENGAYYFVTDGGYTLRYVEDPDITELVIPDEVNGYPVVAVSEDFASRSKLGDSLVSVKLGKNVRTIKKVAFVNCSKVKSIELNDVLETVENNAFTECDIETPLIFPDTIKSIGEYAFMGSRNIPSVTIPNPDCKLGADFALYTRIIGYKGSTAEEYANKYHGNSGVEFCDIEDENTPTDPVDKDGLYYIPVDGGYSLAAIRIDGITDLVIPDEVNGYPVVALNENCGGGGLRTYDIVSVKLGKNVRTIGAKAFEGCKKIKSVELNDVLETVEERAFIGNPIETPLVFPETIKYIGKDSFHFSSDIPSVTIQNPDCVLGENFVRWTSIIGYKGSTAEEYAKVHAEYEVVFCDIENPDTPRYRAEKDGALYIVYNGGYALYRALDREVTEIVVPDEINGYPVVAVAEHSGSIAGCYPELSSLKLGKNVRIVGEKALYDCELRSLELNDGLETIGDNAFVLSLRISEVVIPGSVKSIGEKAFAARVEKATILSPDCSIGKENFRSNSEIVGYKGSTAEAYAEANKLKFTALERDFTKYGDTNCDGKVELADAILILQSLANPDKYGENGSAEKPMTAQGRKNGDVDKTIEGLTGGDALKIQEFLLGKIDSLE